MRLSEIWTYPVKSMIGHTVDSAVLDEVGVVGDRRWAVRDAATGALRGGKKLGALMQCSARSDGDRALITLPDGSTIGSDDDRVHRTLSDVVGADVRLHGRPAPGENPRHREAPPAGVDPLTEIRAVMGRDSDEPLPDFSIFPADVLEFEGPLRAYYDAFPLLVLTTSALRSLQEALPQSAVDTVRFRPSLMVDTGNTAGYPEFAWGKGTRFRIGTAVIEIDVGCPRCVMVTRPVNDAIPANRDILRHIIRELDQNLGVYARVVTPGSIATGDELVPL